MMTIGIPPEPPHFKSVLLADTWGRYRAGLEKEIILGLRQRQEDWLASWMKKLMPRYLFEIAYRGSTDEDLYEVAQWLQKENIRLEIMVHSPGTVWLMRGITPVAALNLFEPLDQTMRWESGLGTDPVTGMRWR